MIRFACGHCGRSIHVDAKYAGRKGKCPKCGEAVAVPERSTLISFRCSHCEHKIEVPVVHAGKKGRCPKCKNAVVVPAPQEKPAERANVVTCSMCGQAIKLARGFQEPAIECPGCGAYIETSTGAPSSEYGGSPLDEDGELAEEYPGPAGRRTGSDRRLIVLVAVAAAVLVVGGVVLVVALRSAGSRQVGELMRAAQDQRDDAAADTPAVAPVVAKDSVESRPAAGATGAICLQFRPIPGTKRTVQVATKSTTSTEMDGQQQNGTNTESVEWKLEVLESPGDGTVAIGVTVAAMHQKLEGQSVTHEYDSTQPRAEGNTMADIYGAYIGNPFTIKVSPAGEIVDLGLDALYLTAAERRVQSEDDMVRRQRGDRAEQAIQTLDSQAGSRENRVLAMKKQLEASPFFGREQVAELMSGLIESLPEKSLRRGDTWADSYSVKMGLRVPMAGTYTVAAVEPEVCTIQMAAEMSPDQEPIVQDNGPMKTSIKLAGSSEATLRFERRTGWLLSREQQIHLRGQMTTTIPLPPSGNSSSPKLQEISNPISVDVVRTMTTLQ